MHWGEFALRKREHQAGRRLHEARTGGLPWVREREGMVPNPVAHLHRRRRFGSAQFDDRAAVGAIRFQRCGHSVVALPALRRNRTASKGVVSDAADTLQPVPHGALK